MQSLSLAKARMEILHGNSVYGKPEKGWDGAVAVDNNPLYLK